MVDTARTQAALLALFANNTDGDISPQDLRDFVVSCFGVWAAIYVADGSTAQAGITTTPEKLTGFVANVTGKGMTPDHTGDSLTVVTDGDYLVLAQIAFSGSNNIEFELHVYVDGVETAFGTHRKLGAGGDVGSCSIIAPLTGLSAAEAITVYINTTASTGNFTPVDAVLFALKMS